MELLTLPPEFQIILSIFQTVMFLVSLWQYILLTRLRAEQVLRKIPNLAKPHVVTEARSAQDQYPKANDQQPKVGIAPGLGARFSSDFEQFMTRHNGKDKKGVQTISTVGSSIPFNSSSTGLKVVSGTPVMPGQSTLTQQNPSLLKITEQLLGKYAYK